jgi:hypothetical protein
LLFLTIETKSQDYGRHIELSLLFYECQRSGPLPKTNRIYWRHDSMLDAGADAGVDLTGGYYDAGDNVKFNFPQAAAITLLAWSGIEFAEGYKKSGQFEYLLDAVKWGTDYFLKCHTSKNELYIQVGDGQVDHSWWVAPEYIQYKYPSFKIDEKHPGTEVAAETAASLAAASILFKDVDSSYSSTLLKHAIELYDFADNFRGKYVESCPNAQGFYNTYNGFNDELAWGAVWLYYATGEEKYNEKYSIIADADYSIYDPYRYTGCTGPISWDDKRPGAYVLIAKLTKDEKRMKIAEEYCDSILTQPKTPGGLWYDTQLSKWASNRYAANAASMLAVFANMLPDGNSKKEQYISFVKSQIDYILGDNPAGVNYVVGAEENSPRSVHHRGASGVNMPSNKPLFNIYTLYGALAGGPGADDSYSDNRQNYEMNEVALDYNAAFTMDLAALVQFGLGTKDGKVEFDRSWPQKAPKADIKIEASSSGIKVSTGSGLMCSGWCVSFKSNSDIQFGRFTGYGQKPDYIACSNEFLDGKGTAIQISFNAGEGFTVPTEFEFQCDGFNHYDQNKDAIYKPEFGHHYQVTASGVKPLFEESKCWPSHIC